MFRSRIGTGGTSMTVPANATLGIDGGTLPIPEPRQDISVRGWATDASQLVDIFAVDVDPTTGAESERLLGSVLPEAGFVAGRGNRGRFRFEVGKGNFTPVTREILARSHHGQVQLADQAGLNQKSLTGLTTGQYQAPTFEFLVADAPPGFPVSPSNFQDFPFLAKGEATQSIGGTSLKIGPLAPFPTSTP
jgi:hypothetical protein